MLIGYIDSHAVIYILAFFSHLSFFMSDTYFLLIGGEKGRTLEKIKEKRDVDRKRVVQFFHDVVDDSM